MKNKEEKTFFDEVFSDSQPIVQDAIRKGSTAGSLVLRGNNLDTADATARGENDSAPFTAAVYRGAGEDEIVLSNGLIRRTFRVAPNAAPVAFDNLEPLLAGSRWSFDTVFSAIVLAKDLALLAVLVSIFTRETPLAGAGGEAGP